MRMHPALMMIPTLMDTPNNPYHAHGQSTQVVRVNEFDTHIGQLGLR